MNLNWRARWVTFWEHRNDDVGAETLSGVNFIHNLELNGLGELKNADLSKNFNNILEKSI